MATQIEKDRRDVVGWAERNLYIRSPETGKLGPLKLERHQRRFLRRATARRRDGRLRRRVVVASWVKRDGKSTCAAVLGAHRMCCFEGQDVNVLANSERQAQSNIMDELKGFFANSPNLQGYVQDPYAGTLTVQNLGNSARSFPCNYRTIQGVQTDLLLCDELHCADDGGKAYMYMSQQTEAAGAQVVVASMAGAPVNANPLWRLYNSKAKHVLFDYRQKVSTPWAKRLAAQAIGELLSGEYDCLFRNAWGVTGLTLFPVDQIEEACLPYSLPRTRDAWYDLCESWGWPSGASMVNIGVGLDRAGVSRTGDRTVWSVVAQFEKEYRVVMQLILPTGSEAEVLEADRLTRSIFGRPNASYFEYYGCSDIVEKVRGAELKSPTNQAQNMWFNLLVRLFKEGRFQFSKKLDVFKGELISFGYEVGGAVTRFGTQGGHDDTVYSAALAVVAASEGVRRVIRPHPKPWADGGKPYQEHLRRQRRKEGRTVERLRLPTMTTSNIDHWASEARKHVWKEERK